ncbi:MerR family transcriptional regulator [Paenibacillus sp. CN-4]|uniref:MerR family transcriptional regulator n=1 Tax=Paenibacillus nanchangensis TaxID=3348343 RepID=UPI00397AF052
MKYCIGEFASILGVTSDTLRLYEKHNIVKPEKDESNSYRYFNDLDVRDLLMSRWYRSLRFPLQDVAGLMQTSSLEGVTDKIKDSRLELEEEVRRLTRLLGKVTELEQEMKAVPDRLNRCILKQVPGLYRIRQTEQNSLIRSEALHRLVNGWMELLPFTFYCFRMEKGGPEQPGQPGRPGQLDRPDRPGKQNGEAFNYSWGLTLTQQDALELAAETGEQTEYLPPALCISTVLRTSAEEHLNRESFRPLYRYMEEYGYTAAGEVFGKILLTEKGPQGSRSYLEVNLPVKLTRNDG